MVLWLLMALVPSGLEARLTALIASSSANVVRLGFGEEDHPEAITVNAKADVGDAEGQAVGRAAQLCETVADSAPEAPVHLVVRARVAQEGDADRA